MNGGVTLERWGGGERRGRGDKTKVAMYKDAADVGIKVPCRWEHESLLCMCTNARCVLTYLLT